MASWATQRRLIYTLSIIGFLAAVLAYPLFSFFYEKPTCFDGVKNQDETGIDCGGSCELLCAFEAVAPVILWSKSLEVEPGLYDAVAYIENPNVGAGARSVPYSFKLYDDRGILVAERSGSTFINPKERLTVFEGRIETGKRTPARTFFEFVADPAWVDTNRTPPALLIQNQIFTDDEEKPKLRALIVNNLLDAVEDISVTALIFDRDDNIVAASKTEVDRLTPESSKTISFIWPQKISAEAIRIEIVPRVNVVGR